MHVFAQEYQSSSTATTENATSDELKLDIHFLDNSSEIWYIMLNNILVAKLKDEIRVPLSYMREGISLIIHHPQVCSEIALFHSVIE